MDIDLSSEKLLIDIIITRGIFRNCEPEMHVAFNEGEIFASCPVDLGFSMPQLHKPASVLNINTPKVSFE
jgi:hypothetical protein